MRSVRESIFPPKDTYSEVDFARRRQRLALVWNQGSLRLKTGLRCWMWLPCRLIWQSLRLLPVSTTPQAPQRLLLPRLIWLEWLGVTLTTWTELLLFTRRYVHQVQCLCLYCFLLPNPRIQMTFIVKWRSLVWWDRLQASVCEVKINT